MRDPSKLIVPAPSRPQLKPSSWPVASGSSSLSRQVLYLAFLATVAVMCAIYTASQLGAIVSARGYGVLGFALFFSVMVAPFLSFAAVYTLGQKQLLLLKAHVACFGCGIVFCFVAKFEFGYVAGDDGIINIFLSVMLVMLTFELAAVMHGEKRRREELGEAMQPRFFLTGLTSAIVVGGCAGGWVWSEMMPNHVVASAETEAGTSPYCITFNGEPARRRADLTGRHMRSSWNRGIAGNFHAVLVIEAPTSRRYFNWSYRANKFQPLNDRTTQQARRDLQFQCEPSAHLARSWL